ncbi:Thioredoxin [Halotydeus destructor]|nr:Thioredoxin [Halotydeus destructor]
MSVLELTEKSALEDIQDNNVGKLIVIDFFATWCGPCKQVAPHVPILAEEYPGVIFIKVDVDEADDLSEEYQVTAMPTFIFIKDGAKVANYTGTDAEAIRKIINEHND